MWELIKGLLAGPTNTNGAVETTATGARQPMFRICLVGLQHTQTGTQCDNTNAEQSAFGGFLGGDGAMFASFLGA